MQESCAQLKTSPAITAHIQKIIFKHLGQDLLSQLHSFDLNSKHGLSLYEYVISLRPYSEHVSSTLSAHVMEPFFYGYAFLLAKNSLQSIFALENSLTDISIYKLNGTKFTPVSTFFINRCHKEFISFSENGQYLLVVLSANERMMFTDHRSPAMSYLQIYSLSPSPVLLCDFTRNCHIMCMSWVKNDFIYVENINGEDVVISYMKIYENTFEIIPVCSHSNDSQYANIDFFNILDIVAFFDHNFLIVYLVLDMGLRTNGNGVLLKLAFSFCELTHSFLLLTSQKYYCNTVILCLQRNHQDLFVQTPQMLHTMEKPAFYSEKPLQNIIPSETCSFKGKKIFCFEPFNFELLHTETLETPNVELYYFTNRNDTCSFLSQIKSYRLRQLYRCKAELDIDGNNLLHRVYNTQKSGTCEISMLLFNPRANLRKHFRFKCYHTTCLFLSNTFILSSGANLNVQIID